MNCVHMSATVCVYSCECVCANLYMCRCVLWALRIGCTCGYVNVHVWLYVSRCMCELFVTVSIWVCMCVNCVSVCAYVSCKCTWIYVYGCVCMPLGLTTPLVWAQGWIKAWGVSAGVKSMCHHHPPSWGFTTLKTQATFSQEEHLLFYLYILHS